MTIKLTRNGRSVSAKQFADELKADMYKAAEAQIRKKVEGKLRGIRCPEHSRAATVKVTIVPGRDKGNISVEPCCDKTKGSIEAIMNGPKGPL